MAEHLIAIEEAESDLLACAAYVAENIKSADGYAAAMEEIVPRYLQKGAVDLAAELANTVDDPFTRDRLLVRVAEKCAAIDDDEYAFQLVEAIEERSTQDEAREQIAAQKSAKGEFAKAFEIAETLPHADYAYAAVAHRQSAAGDEAGGLKTIEKIESPNARASAFLNLATLHLSKNENAEALPLLDQAAASAAEIELEEEKILALNEIANHYVEAKAGGQAVEIFDKAKTIAETLDNVHRDRFLAAIALGFLHSGSLELADRTLDLVADQVQMATALLGFAREFWTKGENSEAVETLEESYAILKSQKDREVRDSRARFALWAAIAVEFARFEKHERAIEIAQGIPEETSCTTALSQIAQFCVAQGKDESARQAINAIADDSQKMFALLGISDVKNKSGNADDAANYLQEAGMLAETVDRLVARSAAFDELAQRFYAVGDTEKTREMTFSNLETIINIRDESDRAAALAKMSGFYQSNSLELNNPEREMILRIIAKSNG